MNEVLQLFDGNAVEDDLLLLSQAERAKKCTGAQAEKLAQKENAILALIGSQWPVKRIAALLEVSDHTVTVMVCRHAEKVATFSKEFADRLLGKGAELLARGLLKADDLSAFQCFVAHGIVTDKAVAIAQNAGMMGEMGKKEISKDIEDHAAAAEKLRQWFEAGAAGTAAVREEPAAIQSQEEPMSCNDLQGKVGQWGEFGVGSPVLGGSKEGAEARAEVEGEGGGGRVQQDGIRLIGEVSGDCSAKADGTQQTTPPPPVPAEPQKNAAPPAQPPASPTTGGEP